MSVRELREDGSYELREDGSFELRDGIDDEPTSPPFFRPLVARRRNGLAAGAALRIVARLRPGAATGDGFVPGARVRDMAPRHGEAAGARLLRAAPRLRGGSAAGAVNYDPAVIDADLLAIAGSL